MKVYQARLMVATPGTSRVGANYGHSVGFCCSVQALHSSSGERKLSPGIWAQRRCAWASEPQNFGANLRRERIRLGVAQDKLARESDLTQTYISQLESAQKAASLDSIERIAAALGIDPSLLLREV